MAGQRYPILKEITIGYDGIRFSLGAGGLPGPPSIPPNAPIMLPDNLLGEGAPKVTTISLNGVQLNWALVRNLRILHATFDDNTVPATNLESIVDALGRCPLLEDLRMTLPTTFLPNGAPSTSPISLRHLRKVSIRSNSDVCTALFQAFADLPRTARISLLSANTSSLQQISQLSSILGMHGNQEGAPAIRAITLTQGALFAGLGGNVGINVNVQVQGADLRATQLCVAGRTYLDRQRHFDVPFSMTPTGSALMSISAIPNSETTTEIVLANILQSWPLVGATTVDLRSCRVVAVPMWRALFENMPSVTTVVLRPEALSLDSLLQLLRTVLREERRLVVRHIILDAGELGFGPMSTLFGGQTVQETPTTRARLNFMRVLQYCTGAAQEGLPLDTVELVNDDAHAQIDRVIQVEPETDWAEIYRDLGEGFVYEGVLHNTKVGPEGVKKDSFVGSKSTKVNDALHRYARRFLF
ncbi:hypothetical protein PENSPDRAFT_667481 [Peniophora sp. CONT]|nr:hypothetical protein PENSPDRAFT_667481 [Peniophora sp. CONT]